MDGGARCIRAFFSLFSLTPLLFRTIEMQKLRKRNPVSIVAFEKKNFFAGKRVRTVCVKWVYRGKSRCKTESEVPFLYLLKFSLLHHVPPLSCLLLSIVGTFTNFPISKGKEKKKREAIN